MTRLNVYLPDELAARAKGVGMNLSAVTQEAVRRALAVRSTDAWLATLDAGSPTAVPHTRALEALDATRDEVEGKLGALAGAPVQRYPPQDLILGAWARRQRLRPADALYFELAATRGWPLMTTDRRLHVMPVADIVTG